MGERILFGLMWAVVSFVAAAVVIMAVAGDRAVITLRYYLDAGAIALAAAGTRLRVLPGTEPAEPPAASGRGPTAVAQGAVHS